MSETLTIEQLVLDELRAAFTRVAEHIGNDSSLDPNSVLGAPFALFMAERAVCKAFRQFADIEKESTTTREILTRLAALESKATPAPTKRQQVAEKFMDAAVGEWGYRATADWLYKAAMRVFYRDPDAHDRLVAMGRLLEQAAQEENNA